MTGIRPSHFDELIEELFAAFDDNCFHSPRRWWPRNGRLWRVVNPTSFWIC